MTVGEHNENNENSISVAYNNVSGYCRVKGPYSANKKFLVKYVTEIYDPLAFI